MHAEVTVEDLAQGNGHGGVPVLPTSSGLVVTGTLPASPLLETAAPILMVSQMGPLGLKGMALRSMY